MIPMRQIPNSKDIISELNESIRILRNHNENVSNLIKKYN